MDKREMHRFTVVLNGTDVNPHLQYGLTQNPFPQLAKAEWTGAILTVQKLGGDPIPNVKYIRDTLKGFSPEFVDKCCKMFKKGEMVKFEVEFPE